MPDTYDRNMQLNIHGDPAREKEFLDSQAVKTLEGGRAAEPQLVTSDNSDLNEQIKAADVLDPTAGEGYVNDDAKPGTQTGANVDAEFEGTRDTLPEAGNPGEDGTGEGDVLTNGFFEDGDPAKGAHEVKPKGKK